MPAQYGLRTAGVIDVQTKSGLFDNGGVASIYGGSRGLYEPSIQYGGHVGATISLRTIYMTEQRWFVLSDAGQAGAEIEVTPAIIEAGKAELREHRYVDDTDYMLEAVYRAMAYVSGRPQLGLQDR